MIARILILVEIVERWPWTWADVAFLMVKHCLKPKPDFDFEAEQAEVERTIALALSPVPLPRGGDDKRAAAAGRVADTADPAIHLSST